MNSEDYQNGVLRTESQNFHHKNVVKDDIYFVFSAFVAASKAMDTLKRALYYGKPLDREKLNNAMSGVFEIGRSYKDREEINEDMPGFREHPSSISISHRALHAAIGLATESGEIVESMFDSLKDNEQIDWQNLYEELSDIAWYNALAINAGKLGDPETASHIYCGSKSCTCQEKIDGDRITREWTQEAIWEKNLAKLKARYPDKFDIEKAYNRDIDAEKKAME